MYPGRILGIKRDSDRNVVFIYLTLIAKPHFSTLWYRADNNMYMATAKVVIVDLHDSLTPQDKKYFRESREAMFGTTLEEVSLVEMCCL